MAKNLRPVWWNPLDGTPLKVEMGSSIQNLVGEREKKKPGPHTLPDNLLLGSRNSWRSFFEECWPEVGWPLECIRKRRASTIADIQKAFETIRGKPRCDLAEVFIRSSPIKTTRKELLGNRIRSNDLYHKIQKLHSERPTLQLACTEAENALKYASAEDKKRIQEEVNRRSEALRQLEESLSKAESEIPELDKTVRAQEVYWYCSQLLDFLHCRRSARNASPRYALDPLNLANALAGLDDMGWRQSHRRCSAMRPDSFRQLPYSVFLLIYRIWQRRSGQFREAPVDFFRAQLLTLPKEKGDSPRAWLCEKWRDLRIAIEESWSPKHPSAFVPHAITSAFFTNLYRMKSPVDRVLEDQEKLVLP